MSMSVETFIGTYSISSLSSCCKTDCSKSNLQLPINRFSDWDRFSFYAFQQLYLLFWNDDYFNSTAMLKLQFRKFSQDGVLFLKYNMLQAFWNIIWRWSTQLQTLISTIFVQIITIQLRYSENSNDAEGIYAFHMHKQGW